MEEYPQYSGRPALCAAELPEQEVLSSGSDLRSMRQDALRAALEMARNTPMASDWDYIIRGARMFLAFIQTG